MQPLKKSKKHYPEIFVVARAIKKLLKRLLKPYIRITNG